MKKRKPSKMRLFRADLQQEERKKINECMRVIEDCVNRRKDKEQRSVREERERERIEQTQKECICEAKRIGNRYKRFELRVGLKMSHWFQTVEKLE